MVLHEISSFCRSIKLCLGVSPTCGKGWAFALALATAARPLPQAVLTNLRKINLSSLRAFDHFDRSARRLRRGNRRRLRFRLHALPPLRGWFCNRLWLLAL